MSSTRRPRSTVLLVDDEPQVTAGLLAVLRREPYQLLASSSGDDALAKMRSQAVYVVVCDEDMPGMPGSSLLAVVADEFPATALIMLTGKATLELAATAINKLGVVKFLQKPCAPTCSRRPSRPPLAAPTKAWPLSTWPSLQR